MLADYAVMREQARVCRSGASEIPPGGGGTAMWGTPVRPGYGDPVGRRLVTPLL